MCSEKDLSICVTKTAVHVLLKQTKGSFSGLGAKIAALGEVVA
jgi:hypothetical protein